MEEVRDLFKVESKKELVVRTYSDFGELCECGIGSNNDAKKK